MKQFSTLFLAMLLALGACKSGKKAYQQGDYETAVYNAVNRLRKSPNNKKAQETLRKAYPTMLNYYQDQIRIAKRSADPLRWELVMDYYNDLNQVYDEIQRAPAAWRILNGIQNFTPEYEENKQKAAEARYALGMEELDKGYREAAKIAYQHFDRCLQLRPGFRDAEERLFQAQDMATVFVQIEPIPIHSQSLKLSNEFFENQMTEFIQTQTWSPFVQFYSAKETNARNREPDHILKMIFDDFVVGQSFVKEREVERSKDSVVVGTVKVSNDSTANAYGTVEATVHQFTKEISSSGLLDVKILDARSNAVISQRKFPGTFVWYDYWGYFNGDERALEEEDEKFVKNRRESPNPPPQQLFVEFTRPIFRQTTDFVTEFYESY